MENQTGTFLIVGGTLEQRIGQINILAQVENLVEAPDVKVLELDSGKKSIGIEESRKASTFLSERPFEKETKVLLIKQADSLTSQAQNALLKTLEESPSYALIALLAEKEHSLLPTVVSRCKIIRLTKNPHEVDEESLIPSRRAEMLVWAGKYSKYDPEAIVEVLKNQISTWRYDHNSIDIETAKNIDLTMGIINDLEGININKSLLLEYYALNLYLKD